MGQANEFRIDSHKLMFHPQRVADWLAGDLTYPLYMEISPTGVCNHRCSFCAKDYLEYRAHYQRLEILQQRLAELASLGVKSIMYAGEGEPLLHRDIAPIVQCTRSSGIDVAMATNGVFLIPELSERIIPYMSWIKVSINAGSPDGYAAIHRTAPEDFHKVFSNIAASANFIRRNGWPCTLGTQAVLLPENADEMELLAQRSKDAGARYLVIKPYSQHPKSHTKKYAAIDYAYYQDMAKRLERFNDTNFDVIFRAKAINKIHRSKRGYERCLALPFWSYIDAMGNVWACNSFIGDERFLYGNIYEEQFEDIWKGERRRRSLSSVSGELDTEGCRMNCRMDEINLYLWELTHPSGHVNFI